MELQVDPTLLVVNLDSCINPDGTRQLVKGGDGCMYTVALATNDDATVMQIPISVHCDGGVQSAFGALSQIQQQADSHNFNELQPERYAQMPNDMQSLVNATEQMEDIGPLNNVSGTRSDLDVEEQTSVDINTLYYNDIYTYLTTGSVPEGASSSHKLLLKKRARSYCVKDGILYYGHTKPKKVITDREEHFKILEEFHVDKETGVHFGVKKMYSAVSSKWFWRKQYVDITNFVRQCSKCTEFLEPRPLPCDEQHPDENSDPNGPPLALESRRVWEKVEVTVRGPYSRTSGGNEFVVTMIDPVSCWVAAQPLSEENFPSQLASFIRSTFCLFGFAKCQLGTLSENLKDAVRTIFQQEDSSMRQFLMKLGFLSNVCVENSLFVYSDANEECSWINPLLKTFVEDHPMTWDSELCKFVLELNTSKRGDAAVTPYYRMFGRNPYKIGETSDEIYAQDKENVSFITQRRRLQSSVMQCRHCEEMFTSKISFRIHQRKHTEEARRSGTLEGEDPIKSLSNRERRPLKRPITYRREQSLRQQGVKKMATLSCPNKIVKEFILRSNKSILPVAKDKYSVASVPSSCQSAPRNAAAVETYNSSQQLLSRIDQVSSNTLKDIQSNLDQSVSNLKCKSKIINTHFLTDDSVQNLLTMSESLLEEVARNPSQLTKDREMHPAASDTVAKQTNSSDISLLQVSSNTVTGSQSLMNPVLPNGDSKLTSHHIVLTSEEAATVANTTVQLSIPEEGLSSVTNGIELIYTAESVQEAARPREQDGKGGASTRMDVELVTCDVCGLQFKHKSRLRMHIRRVHFGVMLRCSECPYTTRCKVLLRNHKEIHKGSYKCNVCDQVFTRDIYLQYHIRLKHTDVAVSYMCGVCEIKFKSKTGLSRHMESIHERPEFPCTSCDYVGLCSNALNCHILRKHKKKFKCDSCIYEGCTKSALVKHMKVVHSDELERKFKCNYCSYRGTKLCYLTEHVKLNHNPELHLHPCPICSKSFKTAIMLKHHLLCHTTKKLYLCKACGHRSRHRQTLHLHLKKVHPEQSMKELFVGPSKEDFESIINSAMPSVKNDKKVEEENKGTVTPSQAVNSTLPSSLLQKPLELQQLPSGTVPISDKIPECDTDLESTRMLPVLDDSILGNEGYTILNLSSDGNMEVPGMDQLVNFSKDDCNFIESEANQIVSYIANLEQANTLLVSSEGDLVPENTSAPSLSSFGDGDLVVLPLNNVIFTDEDPDPTLDHNSLLLDFISEQPLHEEEVSSWDHIPVYPLNS